MTVKIKTERESLIQEWNDVWHFINNSFVMQNKNIKTDDESTSAEIESIMSEIDTADIQLKTSCSTKESKTCHFSNPNAIVESSITSFENHERRSVHVIVHTERTSAIVDFANAIVIRSLINDKHQDSDGPAEVEEQEWKITAILEKRAAGSETVYRVRWIDEHTQWRARNIRAREACVGLALLEV